MITSSLERSSLNQQFSRLLIMFDFSQSSLSWSGSSFLFFSFNSCSDWSGFSGDFLRSKIFFGRLQSFSFCFIGRFSSSFGAGHCQKIKYYTIIDQQIQKEKFCKQKLLTGIRQSKYSKFKIRNVNNLLINFLLKINQIIKLYSFLIDLQITLGKLQKSPSKKISNHFHTKEQNHRLIIQKLKLQKDKPINQPIKLSNLLVKIRYIIMLYKLVLGVVLVYLVSCDIRIQYNQFAAQGQWQIKYSPNNSEQANIRQKNYPVHNNSSQEKDKNSSNQKTQQQQSIDNSVKNQTSKQENKDLIVNQTTNSTQKDQPVQKFNVFQYFHNNHGTMLCIFFDSDLRDAFQNNQKVNQLSIRFHDPKYVDQRMMHFKIMLKNYFIDTDSWEDKHVIANYTYFEDLDPKKFGSTNISYKIAREKMEFFIGDYQISIKYWEKQLSSSIPLSILMLDMFLLYMALRLEKRNIVIQKLSIISLYHFIFFFIYLSTFFLIMGMASLPNAMSILMLCGCLQILIIFKIIKKFQSIIQRINSVNGYCTFYLGIFFYLWLLLNYFNYPSFILVNSLFLVPQIIHSLRQGSKLGNQYEYLVLLSSSQLFFIYLKGYPDNFFLYHPQFMVCAAVILITIFQIWIILTQNERGTYFFIKKSWLPHYYEYYQTFKLDSKSQLYEQQCPICLCSLSQQDPVAIREVTLAKDRASKEQKTQEQFKQKSSNLNSTKKIVLMVTPCKHKFHISCLQNWIDHKRQCPVDRSALPMNYR